MLPLIKLIWSIVLTISVALGLINHPTHSANTSSTSTTSTSISSKSESSSNTSKSSTQSSSSPTTLGAVGSTNTSFGPVALSNEVAGAITPEQFGAYGDGVHDDTASLQQAVNAAVNKTLWLPAGKTFLCSSSITIPSNVTIEGAGSNSVIKFNWFDAQGAQSGGKYYLSNVEQSSGSTNIDLSNFVLQGGGSGYPSGPNAINPNGLTTSIRLVWVSGFSISASKCFTVQSDC